MRGRPRETCSPAPPRAGWSRFASLVSPGACAAFGAIVLLGAQNGGFFADSWGWATLPLLLVVAGVLFTRDVAVTRREALWLGGFALLTAWTALSALWAPTAGPPVEEAGRALLYTAVVAAVVVLGARGRLPYAVLAAAFVLCVWALADRAHGGPARIEGPIGYTNGLGLVAATGILLAVGLRKPPLLATLAVFAPTLALTESRGSLVALAAGLLVLAALALRSRPRLLLALIVAAAAVALLGVTVAGHRGGASGAGRLSSLSSSGRTDYWRTALAEARAHPLLGGGAGTWGRWWLLRRPDVNGALDAHELYLETLAELGAIGLAILTATLAVPLVSLRRALRHEWAPACAAVFVALLVHAALDWDWELPAVSLCGLLCGTALLADGPSVAISGRARVTACAAAVAAAATAFVLQVGNSAQRSAATELDAGRLAAAGRDARRAERWQPWATEPRLLLGQAQLAAGDVEAAARSFRAVLQRDPRNADAWYQLALATGSARARARALQLDPHGAASFSH